MNPGVDGYVDVGGKLTPVDNVAYMAPSYPAGTDIGGVPTTGYYPIPGAPGNGGTLDVSKGSFSGGGGGGTTQPGALGAGAAAPAGSGTGVVDPQVILGPDGNLYGYSRAYDSVKGGYSFTYYPLGPATDLAGASAKSGIPVGMLQQLVQQQQNTINSLTSQSALNPYVPGMTNQQLSQSLDAIRNATQYQTSTYMQQQSGIGGLTLQQVGDVNTGNNTLLDYQQNAFLQGKSAVPGMSGADLQYAAQGYGNQASYMQGVNANQASGVGGMSYGQLGLANNDAKAQQDAAFNSYYGSQSGVGGMTYGQLGLQNTGAKAVQDSAYNANYGAVNPYSGMTNGQTSLDASNAGNANSLKADTWLQGSNAYGGGNRQDLELGTKDMTDTTDRSAAQFLMNNQATQQQANLNDWTRTNSLAGKDSNITYAGNGMYNATDYNGNHQTLSAAQLGGNNSATAQELQQAQQEWAHNQRSYGQANRTSQSNFLYGGDPNSIQSRF